MPLRRAYRSFRTAHVENRQQPPPPKEWPDHCPEWVSFVGNWGDCIAALGNLQELLRRTGGESAGVIYYGRFPALPAFLSRQKGVREVLAVIEPDFGRYLEWVMRACSWAVPYAAWGPSLATAAGLSGEPLWPCQFMNGRGEQVYHPERMIVSGDAAAWACERLPDPGETWLLFPRSTASSPQADEWPYWRLALMWLLAETPGRFALCGTDAVDDLLPARAREITDLIRQTPSMEHVFALSQRCLGIVATTNSLSMWGLVQQIPGVYACNRTIAMQRFYHEWINGLTVNRLVAHSEGIAHFQAAWVSQGWPVHSAGESASR